MAVQNLLQPVLISVFAVLFSDYFCSIFTGLKGHETAVSVAILIIYGIMAAAVIYFLLRIRYLRGKGIDLIQELKVPYADWEAREAECKAMDEAHA